VKDPAAPVVEVSTAGTPNEPFRPDPGAAAPTAMAENGAGGSGGAGSTARRKVPAAGIAIALVIVALVAFLLVSGVSRLSSLFSKHDEVAQVVDQQWSRSVNVEQFAAVTNSDWCDAMPADAYNVSRSKAQRGSREVEDGQVCQTVREDKGDGTFTKRRECETRWRSEPVYDNRCRYQVNRWGVLRTEALRGDSLATPAWPVPQLAASPALGAAAGNSLPAGSGANLLGAQRLGAQSESYEIRLRTAEGKEEVCRYPESRWAGLPSGKTVSLKVGAITGVDCDSVVPLP